MLAYRYNSVRLTIKPVGGGLIATPSNHQGVSFNFEELPTSVRERAGRLLAPDQISMLVGKSLPAGAADHLQYQFDYIQNDQMQRMCIHESACPAELLELIDELIN